VPPRLWDRASGSCGIVQWRWTWISLGVVRDRDLTVAEVGGVDHVLEKGPARALATGWHATALQRLTFREPLPQTR
jgi:hypothetical protein